MSEYCRLCAKLKPITDLINLTSDDDYDKLNIKLLKMNIVIDFELNLPKTFCFACWAALENAFEFVTDVHKSQEVLKTLILDSDDTVFDSDFNIEEKQCSITDDTDIDYPISIDDTKLDLPPIKKELDVTKEEKEKTEKINITSDSTWRDVIWKCIFCETIYTSLKDLNSHAIQEHGCCNPYICSECPAKRYRLDYFIKHINKHRPHLSKSCYECSKVFKTIKKMDEHMRKKHRISENVCNGCNESFTTVEELNNHADTFYLKNSSLKVVKPRLTHQIITNWEMYSWKCTVCEIEYPNLDELTSHSIQAHSRCNPYHCLECPRKPFKLFTFIKHVQQQHYKSLTRSCYKCFKPFDTLTQLYKHHNTHKSKYMCEGCHTAFSTAEELNQHENTYFRDSVMLPRPEGYDKMYKGLQCLVCNKAFKLSSGLRTHLWKHIDRPKEYTCDECGQNFVHKTHFLTHKMKHGTGASGGSFKCEICNKIFTTIMYLRKHVRRIHTTETCVCDICKKTFKHKDYLKSHLLTHSTELPFTCKICHKAFKRKMFLNIHEQRHTGEKNYCCYICERDFQNWSNYNKHMVRKHNMDMAKNKRNQSKWQNQDDSQVEWKKELLSAGLKRKRRKEENGKET